MKLVLSCSLISFLAGLLIDSYFRLYPPLAATNPWTMRLVAVFFLWMSTGFILVQLHLKQPCRRYAINFFLAGFAFEAGLAASVAVLGDQIVPTGTLIWNTLPVVAWCYFFLDRRRYLS